MIENKPDINQINIIRQNLKFLRINRGFTIKELSQKSNIDESILKNIETNKDFKLFYILRLCSIYNVKPSKLLEPLKIIQ